MRKKIAILADFPLHALPQANFAPPQGHYATWLPQLARNYETDNKHSFHWLSLDATIQKPGVFEAWNQHFHVLPTWPRGRATTLFWSDRRLIRKTLRAIGPELVHGWGTENIWGWATVASGIPNIFSVQGLLGLYGKLGQQGWRDRLMGVIEKKVLRKARVITTESPWAWERIQEQTGRKDIRLVEYGVADPFFDVEPQPDLKTPYAVMVGTADHRKGIDVAVRLFCRPELKNFRLKVVGGISPFGEQWQKRSPANVEWLGRKTQSEIILLLARARCLILPSRADVCANVVKEARVVGLPVVASPHGGHTQYVQHGQNGFICPLEAPEAWEKSLQLLLGNPARAREMGACHRELQRQMLRPERTAENFLSLYHGMLSPPSTGSAG